MSSYFHKMRYVDAEGLKMPCTRDCLGRTATCHAECAEYLEWRAARNRVSEKQAIASDARRASMEQVYKNKNRRAMSGYGY